MKLKQSVGVMALALALSVTGRAENLFVVNQPSGPGPYVTEFDANGNSLGVVATNTGTQGIAFDKVGNFYVASGSGNGTVAKYAVNGTLINASYITVADPFGGQNPNPFGLAFDTNGNLFVSILRDSYDAGFVQEYNTNGSLLNNDIIAVQSTFAIAFGTNGNLYVTDLYGNDLREIAPNGSQLNSIETSTGPNGVAVDQSGNVYVALPSQGVVAKYDANLNSISNFVSGLNNPYGLAFDSQGDLYVSDLYVSKIYKYNQNGNLLNTITNGLNRPAFMAVQTVSAPVLGITTISNAPVVVWPASATNYYILQTTTNLASDNWVTVSNGVPFVGVWVTNAPPNSFFRLIQPFSN